ncbi:MAG TPA: 3,4-dihydroxy-2-butanone-4-phosphate synthase [Methanothrix sp.]|nr:3,4-dihydroxy-2-butanone-4-phosphate synthase [Methanothrix sp.]HPJ83748.1 3,4-dihydroxy-2-butanone-4-phosphate synthase [Methanothrix sp.]HPR67440.1 3,4-dihydroxy-2-butanone-4-phosphate synthase [Methanothrix sp.]
MTRTECGRDDERRKRRAVKASMAAEALKRGEVVLLYDFDDRERETDLVIGAEFVTAEHVWQLRRDAGGLICVAMDPAACSKLGLPYIADVLKFAAASVSAKGEVGVNGRGNEIVGGGGGFEAIDSLCEREGDIPYDSKSSFSLSVNHRETFTGITDIDRALTISRLAAVARSAMNGGSASFGAEFRSPGHVPLLRAAPGLLAERRGQTELSIVLARAAMVAPAVVVCEMLDGRTGRALSKEGAMRYARERNLTFVEGEEVLGLFEEMMD